MSDTDADTLDETPDTDVDWKAEATKWQGLARKHEGRAKDNASAAKELEQLKASRMSDTEKAVAEAEQRGRSAALAESGKRLAAAELKAAAVDAGVNKDTLKGFLEFADLGRFVGDDGQPDDKLIAAAVKQLGGGEKTTNFDGGARTSAGKPNDMNSLIRRQAGLG